MPRVRLPNASLIASADPPFLHFLAPRVFAEPPIVARSRRRNGKNDGAQEEKKTVATSQDVPRTTHSKNGLQSSQRSYDARSCLKKVQQSTAAGLLRTCPFPVMRSGAPKTSKPTSVDRIYADISSVARQHIRSYATAGPFVRRVGNETTLTDRGKVLASRRSRALAVERKRLRRFISPYAELPQAERRKKGQHRSLLRRITNLVRWDTTSVDLSKRDGSLEGRVWLVRGFAALDRAVFPKIGRHTRKIRILHHPRCPIWNKTLFDGVKQGRYQRLWENWIGFDIAVRKWYWSRLLLYIVDRKPGRALDFMLVLVNDPLIRGRLDTGMLADTLGHLSKIHLNEVYEASQDWATTPDAEKRAFIPGFYHIYLRVLKQQPDVCSQDLLHNIARLAGIEDLKKIFDELVKWRTHFGYDTLLHYANVFAKASEFGYALRCLDESEARNGAESWRVVVDRTRLRWTAALILRKSMGTGANYHDTPGIVERLVRKGIKMDILLYNVVMHNAMDAGDYTTAFKVYNSLEENSIKPDQYTFSILLHGCTLQDTPAIFSDFASYCAEIAKETRDSWLATDYLYYLYIRHQDDANTEQTSALLWRAYLGLFSAVPLEPFVGRGSWQLSNAISQQQPASDKIQLEPSPIALYIMLQLEIKSALAVGNQRVMNLYEQFKSIASIGSSPALTELAEAPTIWNAFLLAFCKKQQFASASQLIKDMSESSTQPNVYSWNIFMQAFFKTDQVQAADRVFEIMRNRGVDPDQYTYGVMLRGYAKAQLVDRIGQTMQHVSAEQEMDPDLLQALAKVIDRKELMIALEKSQTLKELNTREQADEVLTEHKTRWEPPHSTPMLSHDTIMSVSTREDVPEQPQGQVFLQDESSLDDDGLLSFLQMPAFGTQDVPPVSADIRTITQKPSTIPQVSQTPARLPRQRTMQSRPAQSTSASHPAKPNSSDPEHEYRKLQEQLGIPTPEANTSFKSMLPEDMTQFPSMLPAESIQPKISKELPKFGIRKVMGSKSTDRK